MTKLTERERESFEDIIRADLQSIDVKVFEQVRIIWEKARGHLIRKLGHDKLLKKKEELQLNISKLQEEIHQIEEELNSKPLTRKQVISLGGSINREGRGEGANFYGMPITSQFEYEIVKIIKKYLDLEAPAKFLHDLGRSALREIAMSGTFEQARKVYQQFYALDFRKYGVDIPPRLTEIKKENNPLLIQKKAMKKAPLLDLPKVLKKQEEIEKEKNKR